MESIFSLLKRSASITVLPTTKILLSETPSLIRLFFASSVGAKLNFAILESC
jgi:hypothetical protein